MKIKPKPEHEATFQELVQLLNRHKDEVTSVELLAIASNMVGKILAMQDQRTMTPEKAMQIVKLNLELGNQQAIDELASTSGTMQ